MSIDLRNLKLIHHPLCPLCREIRILLVEYDTRHCQEETIPYLSLYDKPKTPLPFHQYQWKKHVPILRMNTNTDNTHTGLIAIKLFLKTLYKTQNHSSTHNFHQLNEIERIKSSEIIFAFTHSFYHNIIIPFIRARLLPFESPQDYSHESPNTIRKITKRLKIWLDDLEHLLFHQPCFTGRFIGITDFCVAAHMSTLDYFGDIPWHQYPELKSWYSRIKSRPSMRSLSRDFLSVLKPSTHYKNLDF